MKLSSIKNKFLKYEQQFSLLAVVFGFLVDNLTLRRIDLWAENLLIIIYLSLALLSIFVLNFHHAAYFKHKFFKNIDLVFSVIMQFTFGALFSVFFVFYFRSACVVTSWLFIVFLLFLLIANEFFRDKYKKLSFQLLIFYIALFSYSVFLIPLILRKMNDYTFVLSNVFSIVIILIVLFFIRKIFPKRFYLNKRAIGINIFSVFLIFNLFYFTNIIPPIPLSLNESEIVHTLKRVNDSYEVSYERAPFWAMSKTSNTFSMQEGERLYFFASVFAPTKINTMIYHKWFLWENEKWVLLSDLAYPIRGGRDGGYRGYSYKSSLKPGVWKVQLTNERGQVLGQRKFKIKTVEESPKLYSDLW